MAAIGDEQEERAILMRLGLVGFGGASEVIGVIRPAGQAAVLSLTKKGLVTWSWGAGKDAGVMLVRKAADGRPPRYPGAPLGGGLRA